MIRELPDSKGYNAILVVVDCLSKRIHAVPTVTSLDSAGVPQLFLEHVWCHHRLLEEVISNCGPAFVSNFSHKLATLLGVKLTPSTSYHLQTDHFLQKSVVAPDMLQEQLGDSCRVQGGDCGDSMNLLGQAIHHHKDSIVSLGVREFSDHVYRDHLPVLIRDLVRDQLPHLLCREGLHLVACVASCDKPSNVPGQPWPPVVLQHQF